MPGIKPSMTRHCGVCEGERDKGRVPVQARNRNPGGLGGVDEKGMKTSLDPLPFSQFIYSIKRARINVRSRSVWLRNSLGNPDFFLAFFSG